MHNRVAYAMSEKLPDYKQCVLLFAMTHIQLPKENLIFFQTVIRII